MKSYTDDFNFIEFRNAIMLHVPMTEDNAKWVVSNLTRIQNYVRTLENDRGTLKYIAKDLAAIWFYGNFEPETERERVLEQMMISCEMWPIIDEDDLMQKLSK